MDVLIGMGVEEARFDLRTISLSSNSSKATHDTSIAGAGCSGKDVLSVFRANRSGARHTSWAAVETDRMFRMPAMRFADAT